MTTKVTLLLGGKAIDDRGELTFANDFDLSTYRRFYNLKNHSLHFVRAWHGHKKEGKAFFVQKGSFIVSTVLIDDWDNPSDKLPIERFVLSDQKPSILIVPPGYANGSMNLTPDAILTVFSTSSLNESLEDDFRFHSYFWNPWKIENR